MSFSTSPLRFIADIGANHDASLDRAKELIFLAKEAGADVAKFQHFEASKIVSSKGFDCLDREFLSHQKSWSDSVFSVYDRYHLRREWNSELIQTCIEADIEFMTTPYDRDAMTDILPFVNAIKIGSGDITHHPFLEYLTTLGKPLLLATGASSIDEVDSAFQILSKAELPICIMQCNTNYTGSRENFRSINLNVLDTFKIRYPTASLGLSDHTPGHATVLGAIAKGASVIEKHFTDDPSRTGPDHHFAMDPLSWSEMVDRSRELVLALGDGVKRVEQNESDTVVIQRRAIRASREIGCGEVFSENNIECLRPCPPDAFSPAEMSELLGKTVRKPIARGDHIRVEHISD